MKKNTIPYFCIFLHSETYLQDKMQGLQIDIISYALMLFGFIITALRLVYISAIPAQVRKLSVRTNIV